jgi:hypothetical protein
MIQGAQDVKSTDFLHLKLLTWVEPLGSSLKPRSTLWILTSVKSTWQLGLPWNNRRGVTTSLLGLVWPSLPVKNTSASCVLLRGFMESVAAGSGVSGDMLPLAALHVNPPISWQYTVNLQLLGALAAELHDRLITCRWHDYGMRQLQQLGVALQAVVW